LPESCSTVNLYIFHVIKLQEFRNRYMHETFTDPELQRILNSLHDTQNLPTLQTNICSGQEIAPVVLTSIEKLKGISHSHAREKNDSMPRLAF